MLDRYHASTLGIGRGNPKPFMELWSHEHENDVSLFGAFGPCKRGWDELSRTFRWVGSVSTVTSAPKKVRLGRNQESSGDRSRPVQRSQSALVSAYSTSPCSVPGMWGAAS
jgi:hypothetical protein